MNTKHEWFNTLIMTLALAICLFAVVDIAYDERLWEFDKYGLKARFQALALVVVVFCFGSYVFKRMARTFIRKNKDKKRTSRTEYLFVFLISFVALNLTHLFVVYYITEMGYRIRESLLINVTVSVLLFLYYLIIRNRILVESLIEQSLQLEKVKVDQLETELKFLKSQYHPHFLFNALNTIYFQVDEKSTEAKQSIEKLSDLLRYQLYDIDQKVSMEQEINYLKSYIAFQQLRMSEKLTLDLFFDPELKEQKIHPLLFQPLVENAFKYVRGDYRIELEMRTKGNQIRFEIRNSITQPQNTNNRGIGIENLKRRLNLLYPNRYDLEVKQTERLFVVRMILKTD